MSELSQTVKNFITEFEMKALPHINGTAIEAKRGETQPMTIFVSMTTLQDPQLRELLGMSNSDKTGAFLGVTVKSKPDMSVEVYELNSSMVVKNSQQTR